MSGLNVKNWGGVKDYYGGKDGKYDSLVLEFSRTSDPRRSTDTTLNRLADNKVRIDRVRNKFTEDLASVESSTTIMSQVRNIRSVEGLSDLFNDYNVKETTV
jgi:hypothetical protein